MAAGNFDLRPENTEHPENLIKTMASKVSEATTTSAITILEKELNAVENVRKWDARGALLGHPGPSPPFGKEFQF